MIVFCVTNGKFHFSLLIAIQGILKEKVLLLSCQNLGVYFCHNLGGGNCPSPYWTPGSNGPDQDKVGVAHGTECKDV